MTELPADAVPSIYIEIGDNFLKIFRVMCPCCGKRKLLFIAKGELQLSPDDAIRLAIKLKELALFQKVSTDKPGGF